MRVYISGRMTGLPLYNRQAFDAAAADLRGRGFQVISPAELNSDGASWAEMLGREIVLLVDRADAIVLLPDWQQSRGARLESFAAFLTHKSILHYPSLRRVARGTLVRAWLNQ